MLPNGDKFHHHPACFDFTTPSNLVYFVPQDEVSAGDSRCVCCLWDPSDSIVICGTFIRFDSTGAMLAVITVSPILIEYFIFPFLLHPLVLEIKKNILTLLC